MIMSTLRDGRFPPVPQGLAEDQRNVKNFLGDLNNYLNKIIPIETAKDYKKEGDFFKLRVIPGVHSFLMSRGYGTDQAKSALLAEGYGTKELRTLVSGTPASKQIYPFKKWISLALKAASTEWWVKTKGLYASCPDFALRSPHRIVFEGKLFREGSLQRAKSELVKGVFECAFYRGLPTLFGTEGQDSRGYDYGCLLAYDSSNTQSLVKAWKELQKVNEPVALSCWKDLRVYVMVLPQDQL